MNLFRCCFRKPGICCAKRLSRMLLSHPAEFSERQANNRKCRIPDLLGIMSSEVGKRIRSALRCYKFRPSEKKARVWRGFFELRNQPNYLPEAFFADLPVAFFADLTVAVVAAAMLFWAKSDTCRAALRMLSKVELAAVMALRTAATATSEPAGTDLASFSIMLTTFI